MKAKLTGEVNFFRENLGDLYTDANQYPKKG